MTLVLIGANVTTTDHAAIGRGSGSRDEVQNGSDVNKRDEHDTWWI